ncbi:hypothetical protein [Allosphingosinicella deserti]|nr:hypothetical protein [Sphingomonas deserti]
MAINWNLRRQAQSTGVDGIGAHVAPASTIQQAAALVELRT